MKNDFFVADVDGVSSVGASGCPDDHVVLLRENVDEFSFSFISPLASDNGGDHTRFDLKIRFSLYQIFFSLPLFFLICRAEIFSLDCVYFISQLFFYAYC